MSHDLTELVRTLGRPRVLVLGDLMLDRYVWGDAARISQEAPVILLQVDKREERLGGASSVATMLSVLGAQVSLVGVVGDDADGVRVRALLDGLGVDRTGVITDTGRPTTVKERYIGRAQHKHPQQMLRVDYETREPLSGVVGERVFAALTAQLATADVLLISDYDKGVCTPLLLHAATASARAAGVRVLADPVRGGDYTKYRGCSAITPNRLEAGLAVGRQLHTTADALAAAAELLHKLDLEAAVVTLDKDGMALAHRDGRRALFPTRPRQVYDITGAGDMVLSVLGLAIAAGADYGDAIRLANHAGGLEVERVGVVAITRGELRYDLAASDAGKLRSRDELLPELAARRAAGQRIAFTNGCFDLLHAGHVQYLREAKEQADLLVVGLNSDASVRALKGPTRPLQSEDARATVIGALQAVDFVCVFGEATPQTLIEAVRPDVLVKGADYRRADVVGGDFVESYGGRVHLAGLRAGYSTTNLVQKSKAA